LTPEQKQSELQRHRAILLATLDYMEEHFGGSFVHDQYDPVTEYYRQQKIQTEKYFKQRRLDRLQQRLASLTKGLQHRPDLAFAPYIKEKTGYDIDIFEDLRNRVNAIVAQNGICGKRKGEYCEVISRVEKDGIEVVTITISTGPKPKHFEEQWATSPDGKRKLVVVQLSDGKHASTYVAVHFPTASGAVYGTSGIRPDVKAWWKDNSTIVIETKKVYEANTQNKQVRSFDDVISIEYIAY